MIVVREAAAQDDFAVGELLVSAFEETYRVKMPEVTMSNQRRAQLRAVEEKRKVAKVWVALLDDKVIGTVAVWPPGAPGSEAWVAGAADLRHLAVDTRHRKSEASKLLLDEAEKWAREHGASAVCLHVRRGVEGVARLYLNRGYQRVPSGDLDKLPDVFLEAFVLRWK
ncbi:MAG: GNAT family N-acetyltransferase [Myxococcaceae bacterium]